MIQCSKCGREFIGGKEPDWVASMSGSIMGDECIDSWYFCQQCGVYTVEHYRDNFTGLESAWTGGPIDKSKGDAQVAIIRRCSEPWEKRCRCAAHLAYFGDNLD